MHQCPLELYLSVGLMCQAIGSTQFSKPGCPFPPPGWSQGPTSPHQILHYLLVVTAKEKSLNQGQKYHQLCSTDTGEVIFLDGCFLAVVFPCSSCIQASSLHVACPLHFVMPSTWSLRKNYRVARGVCQWHPFCWTEKDWFKSWDLGWGVGARTMLSSKTRPM